MERIFYLISLMLMSFAVYSQTNDKKTKEYYDNGCENVFKKNYPGAITEFSEAIRRDSGFIQAYENGGRQSTIFKTSGEQWTILIE